MAGAEDRLEQFGTACADQAGKPDDLTGPHRERHRLGGAVHLQSAHLEDRIRLRLIAFGEQGVEFAADHRGDDVVVGDLVDGLVEDQAAVAQHHHPVGDGADLGHLVGGVDHRHAVVAQSSDDLVQAFDLALGDRRCGFVEHDHLGAGACRLHDLDDLTHADGQAAHPRGRRDRDVEDRQGLGGLADHGAPVQERADAQFPSDEEVLVDRHVVDGGQFLRHDGDAVLDRVAGVAGSEMVALHGNGAVVGVVLAADDLHERRLARPVLSG